MAKIWMIACCSWLSVSCSLANESNNHVPESVCFGSTGNGALQHGVALPAQGENFTSYSLMAQALDRNYVHSKVASIVVNAFTALAQSHPQYRYKYAETGAREGGKFYPHKTHQNGLSVDFMTPMIDENGQSQWLPTHPFNRYGYDIELNKQGKWDSWQIDYEAMALHLYALHIAAIEAGVDIDRVIFDPKLQPPLWQTSVGSYLKKHVKFSKRRSWVRHDEHYHVDFKIRCQPLN
ncbi:hypothetical protein VST7929_02799 [Vibrio stylophorae]|uniref:Penicillin-insensitive murein endopeptidase n=1 Tax=Vibrio stylophorae TaxID=659351 RepID=A0ABN8DZL8_9VIBR|nr:penicillin-insensitive murein endopeptidase [Vibrio stylophorae]CAH0535138.1 hypothetical protein VST7929_02799 [Vibrio stylophorae]